MIEIRIVAVGRIKEKYLSDGIAEYQKRSGRFGKVEIIEVADFSVNDASLAERARAMEREADLIFPKIKGFCIVLDGNGALCTSEELAVEISRAAITTAAVTFVVGGSYGLAPRIKSRADLALCFGRTTFPHQLVRLMLMEQVYRTLTILNNHPYHK